MTKLLIDGLVGNIDRTDNFPSKFVIPRRVDIWTPPSYTTNLDQRYKVLYMHDGENVFDSSTSAWSHVDWGIDDTVTRLMGEGRVQPTMVVALWSTNIRASEYTPQKLPETASSDRLRKMLYKRDQTEICSDNYLRFIVEEVKPFVDKQYRTKVGMEDTTIMGASLGGLVSMYAVCEYPQIFGGAGCVSTHFPIGRGIALHYMMEHLPDPKNHKFYFDFGTRTVDKNYEIYQKRADRLMTDAGYQQPVNWITMKFEGHEHSEKDWRRRVHFPLEFLLK